MRRILSSQIIVALGLIQTLHAHNGAVHRDMTDLSYQVMRLVGYAKRGKLPLPRSGTDLLANPGVDNAEWTQYLNDIQVSVDKLATLPDDPAPDGSLLAATGIFADYKPGGVYNAIDTPDTTLQQLTAGRVLGYWAKSIDDEDGDTHLWFRPTSVGYLAILKDLWQKAWKAGVAAAIAPLLCIVEFVTGGGDCVSDAKDMATETDLVSKVEGLIPGIGDLHGDPFTTIWHFINVQNTPMVSNDYDDRQGLYYLEAAWWGPKPGPAGPATVPYDPVDVAILIGSTLSGLSINYGASDGPTHYEITSGADFHSATIHRTKGQWQYLPLGLTPVEPVDNLGRFGWNGFVADKTPAFNRRWLGWPLHAIEDASAPHHVIGVTGWGHRPFEDAEEQNWLALRFIIPTTPGRPENDLARVPAPSEIEAQVQQAKRILATGFAFRHETLQWRKSHPASGHDIPIRDIVTEVAKFTLSYSSDQMTSVWWPYKADVSAGYLAGLKEATVGTYLPDADRTRPLIEFGCGAAIGFLISAMEVIP